jgi:hypothetical protein
MSSRSGDDTEEVAAFQDNEYVIKFITPGYSEYRYAKSISTDEHNNLVGYDWKHPDYQYVAWKIHSSRWTSFKRVTR